VRQHPDDIARIARESVPDCPAGWYSSDPQVTWNWTDLYGAGIEAAHCPAESTGTGQRTAVKITASCTNSAGAVTKQSVTVSVDTRHTKGDRHRGTQRAGLRARARAPSWMQSD
jgi:hypothetical protein